MKQISLRTAAKSRRGFSLAEVMIGLTFVVMVTIAALSLMISSIQMETKYLSKTTALCACESAVAVVRYADNAQELAEGLLLLTKEENLISPYDEETPETPDDGVVEPTPPETSTIQFQQNGVTITVSFDDAFKTFTIIATNVSGREELHRVTYEK